MDVEDPFNLATAQEALNKIEPLDTFPMMLAVTVREPKKKKRWWKK